jgi:Methyltransferase domain
LRILHALRDPASRFSIAHRMRSRRFAFFLEWIAPLPRPMRILDVGGTEGFWERMGFLDGEAAELTIVNLEAPAPRSPHVRTLSGDACAMPMFADGSFDVVFSNSVLEHVGDYSRQRAMAAEIRRIGRRYFVQTPSRHFPIEPHFMFPWFQFLPLRLQAFLLMNLKLSFGGRIATREAAEATARSITLLGERDFVALFPGARIYRERFAGLTKSFVAYGEGAAGSGTGRATAGGTGPR